MFFVWIYVYCLLVFVVYWIFADFLACSTSAWVGELPSLMGWIVEFYRSDLSYPYFAGSKSRCKCMTIVNRWILILGLFFVEFGTWLFGWLDCVERMTKLRTVWVHHVITPERWFTNVPPNRQVVARAAVMVAISHGSQVFFSSVLSFFWCRSSGIRHNNLGFKDSLSLLMKPLILSGQMLATSHDSGPPKGSWDPAISVVQPRLVKNYHLARFMDLLWFIHVQLVSRVWRFFSVGSCLPKKIELPKKIK